MATNSPQGKSSDTAKQAMLKAEEALVQLRAAHTDFAGVRRDLAGTTADLGAVRGELKDAAEAMRTLRALMEELNTNHEALATGQVEAVDRDALINTKLDRIGRFLHAEEQGGPGTRVQQQLRQGQVLNAGLGGGQRDKSFKPPPSYLTFALKDDETWAQFRKKFLGHKKLANYNDDIAKTALLLCMKGSALVAVEGINHDDPTEDLEALMHRYEEKFVPPSASGLAQTRYEQARQGPKEDITNWHSRLHTLFIRAYPQTYANGDETSLTRHFMMGCFRQTVRDQVQRGAPVTYNDALVLAQREMAVVDSKRHIDEVQPMDINALTIEAIDMATAKCHNCGKVGHFKAACRSAASSLGAAAREVSAMTRSTARGNQKPQGPWQKRKPTTAPGVTLRTKQGQKWRFPKKTIQEMLAAMDEEGEIEYEDDDADEVEGEEIAEITKDDDGNPSIQSITSQDF